MKLVKYTHGGNIGAGVQDGDAVTPLDLSGPCANLASFLETDDPAAAVQGQLDSSRSLALADVELLAPIDNQEVWAAGVTYKRSQTARMEESEAAASCYDRVYVSDRPELFLKATPNRVVGPSGALRIREDSQWNVPEPEYALVISSQGRLVGATIGNDMSSRDIEGENPLYLPQAKVYNDCCGLGPCITLIEDMPERAQTGIRLSIRRGGEVAYADETSVEQMARTFEDLIGWLTRDNSFPNGAFLLTGTGIVPDSEFTLLPGDEVTIEIDGVGSLVNPIVQGY